MRVRQLQRALDEAAEALDRKHKASFARIGAQLRVRRERATSLKSGAVTEGLRADVEWSMRGKPFLHAHVSVLQRNRFSRTWSQVRPIDDAVGYIEKRVMDWLGNP